MNKIHTINLGGHPFTVDEDAFEYLQAYIRSLRKHFKTPPDVRRSSVISNPGSLSY